MMKWWIGVWLAGIALLLVFLWRGRHQDAAPIRATSKTVDPARHRSVPAPTQCSGSRHEAPEDIHE